MKPKHIITLTACLFFLFTSLSAVAGERVHISILSNSGTIYEKGAITEIKYSGPKATSAELEKWRVEVLEKYLSAGYKIISSFAVMGSEQYILEKP